MFFVVDLTLTSGLAAGLAVGRFRILSQSHWRPPTIAQAGLVSDDHGSQFSMVVATKCKPFNGVQA